MSEGEKKTVKELKQAHRDLLTGFLQADEKQVLRWFGELEGAKVSEGQYVYVPGTRKDRLLLVAHADTVLSGAGNPIWMGDVCLSAASDFFPAGSGYGRGAALGADDRAGCAMLWGMAKSGHSLLITNGEERGLVGARRAAAELKEELKEHGFAIEVDRRGSGQAVFYSVATKEFKEHILGLLGEHDAGKKEWKECQGSVSDISHICEEVGICGVNLSAGYIGEHTDREILVLTAWQKTRYALAGILGMEKHKRWELKKKKAEYDSWWKGHSSEPMPAPKTDESLHYILFKVKKSKGSEVLEEFRIPVMMSKTMEKKLKAKIRGMEQGGRITGEKAVAMERVVKSMRERTEKKEDGKEGDCECGHLASMHRYYQSARGACCLPNAQCKCVRYKEELGEGVLAEKTVLKYCACGHSSVYHMSGSEECVSKIGKSEVDCACVKMEERVQHRSASGVMICECKHIMSIHGPAGCLASTPCKCVIPGVGKALEREVPSGDMGELCTCKHSHRIHAGMKAEGKCLIQGCGCLVYDKIRRALPPGGGRCEAINAGIRCSKEKGHPGALSGEHFFLAVSPGGGESVGGTNGAGEKRVVECEHYCFGCKDEWWHKAVRVGGKVECKVDSMQPCPKHTPATEGLLDKMELVTGERMEWGCRARVVEN